MTARFNPPPFWRPYLSADFQPATGWIPDTAWGAPPAGWAMWVDAGTGFAAAPPEAYRNNPYLFMSVMPGFPAPPAPPAEQFSKPADAAPPIQAVNSTKRMGRGLKVTLWVVGIIVFGSIIGSCGGDKETPAPAATPSATPTKAQASATPTATANAQTAAEALRSAESYLDFSAFSRTGLIEQLKFEDYSTKDAMWAVDRVTIDWKEQAAESAESYLKFSSFSRTGLTDQLIFEGFTPEQAKYGVGKTGL